MPPPRRLPVLQDAGSSPDEDRPAWHWTIIGAVFVFSIWAPLAMVSNWVAGRTLQRLFGDVPAGELAGRVAAAPESTRLLLWLVTTGAPVVVFLASCWAAGALVGRFGGKAGPKEAAAGAAISAAIGSSLSLSSAGWAAALAGMVLLVPLGVAGAWVGGRFGLGRRVASITRAPPPPGEKGSV